MACLLLTNIAYEKMFLIEEAVRNECWMTYLLTLPIMVISLPCEDFYYFGRKYQAIADKDLQFN